MNPTEVGHRVRHINHLAYRAKGVGVVVRVDDDVVHVLFHDCVQTSTFDGFRRGFFIL